RPAEKGIWPNSANRLADQVFLCARPGSCTAAREESTRDTAANQPTDAHQPTQGTYCANPTRLPGLLSSAKPTCWRSRPSGSPLSRQCGNLPRIAVQCGKGSVIQAAGHGRPQDGPG